MTTQNQQIARDILEVNTGEEAGGEYLEIHTRKFGGWKGSGRIVKLNVGSMNVGIRLKNDLETILEEVLNHVNPQGVRELENAKTNGE